MPDHKPSKSWSDLLPAAAETTAVPVSGKNEAIGALMFLACLAYPGIGAADHKKRDAFMTSIGEYIAGGRAYSVGRRRLPKGTKPTHPKRTRLFATLNRADHLIRVRLQLADIAYTRRGQALASELRGPIRLVINGPASLAKAIDEMEGREPRTWWRAWKQTLPVMHLALALRHATKELSPQRDPLTLALMRHHSVWLPEAVRRAPFEAVALGKAIPTYSPALRIDLVPA